jgi:hypothetical protein
MWESDGFLRRRKGHMRARRGAARCDKDGCAEEPEVHDAAMHRGIVGT